MKIHSSPYTFERIFHTNLKKKPTGYNQDYQERDDIQKPGNSKKEETKENPKRIFSLLTRMKISRKL